MSNDAPAEVSTLNERRSPSDVPASAGDLELLRAEFAPGVVIDGAYRVLDVLGEGSMGIVLRAHDRRLDRDVALKTVRGSMLERPDARARFLAEARAMAHVRHPNVVGVHALGEWRGIPYIAMEHIPGLTLEEWLGPVGGAVRGIAEPLGLLDQLCLGVEAIHASGVAHRDLKAANVLVSPPFRVVVADLGITRSLRGATVAAHSMSGTPLTMAPEVIRGLPLDARSLPLVDVYALGILAYRSLVGSYPFAGTDADSVLRAHLTDSPPRPSSLRPDLPPAFDAVLLRALAKEPGDRTPSAAAFRQALRDAGSGAVAVAPSPRFLVVDDDGDHRALIASTLVREFAGAVVDEAGDGLAALAAAKRTLPSVIVTDLRMPRMNGNELLRAVRATPELAQVPVVVMTGTGSASEWKTLAEMGATACLVKPFDARQISSLLRAILENPRAP